MSKESNQDFSIHPYFNSPQKRIFDFSVSLIWLLISIPLLIGVAIGVIFSSGLPVFYTQVRLGHNKKPFRMIKFRTMYVDAHADLVNFISHNQAPKPMFKIFNDPRFVGIGKFLANTGLDELPQLINVIFGRMSLVGPRPLPKDQAQKLSKNWQFRFKVKPGIFSEWTIAEDRHQSSKKWIALDKATLKKGSVFNDLRIIIKTILKVDF
jgi:lipopolysaccharide/colanic/teichoic acid biosynthesis glycosyltransferase